MDLAVLSGRGLTIYISCTLGLCGHTLQAPTAKEGGAQIFIKLFSVSFLTARFEDFEPQDTRVQYFWEALNNFTNGE